MDRRVEYDLQAVRAIHRASRLTAQVHPSNQLAQGGSLSPVPTSSLLKYLGDNVITSIPLGSVVMTERYGGLLVAEVLKAHGVQFIFTLTGGHISPILVASKTAGIRIIDVRHEASAVFAADAVARMSGVPGVAAVTAGPGITNTITAIKNAQMAQSPVVLLGGAAATNVKGRGALQDIDQLAVIRPIVKFAATVSRVRDIVPTLRRAFQEAMSGVPGPVFVELPLDVLYPITEVKAGMGLLDRRRAREVLGSPELEARVVLPEEAKEAGLSVQAYLASKAPSAPVFLEPWASVPSSNATITNTTSATASGSGNGVPKQYVPPPQPPFLVRTVMQYQLAYLYAGAWSGETEDFSPLPVEIPQPAVADVDAVVAALRKAKHPVLLLASQSVLLPPAPSTTSPSSSKTSAEAAAARLSPLRSAIERLGMPTFLAGMARGLLGKNHPLHIRQQRGHALKKADLVILAGTVCDFRMQYGRALPSNAFIVSLNRCEKDVVLNSPLFWKPSVASVSDPAQFLIQLANKFNPLLSPSSASKASPSSAPTPAVDLSVPPPLPPLSGYVTPSSGPTFAFAAWAKTLKDIEATKEAENKRISTAPVTDRDGVEAMMYNPMVRLFTLSSHNITVLISRSMLYSSVVQYLLPVTSMCSNSLFLFLCLPLLPPLLRFPFTRAL